MTDYHESALVVIDMQNGFITPASPLCVAGAAATIPACTRALEFARTQALPIFHTIREYAEDGSDVEVVRHKLWSLGGKPVCQACVNPHSLEIPTPLKPQPGESIIIKPRFSALFHTKLDLVLRRLKIKTLVLIGTTTPNCVRSTCYDALSLDYNVVVLEDCTSSRTPEVQAANIKDMAYIGAHIMTSEAFCAGALAEVADQASHVSQMACLAKNACSTPTISAPTNQSVTIL